MSAWFWSLRGVDLLLATLGIIGGVVGSLIAMVVGLGRVITRATEHDQRKCGCWDCKRRRNVAAEKRWKAQEDGSAQIARPMMAEDPSWIDTAHLDRGMQVGVDKDRYYVKRINTNINGYIVELENMRTRRDIVATVKFEYATRKYWHVLDEWRRR